MDEAQDTMLLPKRLLQSFLTALIFCALLWGIEQLGNTFFPTSTTTTSRGFYSLWVVLGPCLSLVESDIRRRFWKPLLGALAGAILGSVITTAFTGTGHFTIVKWFGAVFGNTVGFYFTLPVLLEIGRYVKMRDAKDAPTSTDS